jgi:hypothetical protein
MGEKWDLHRSHKGLTWDSRKKYRNPKFYVKSQKDTLEKKINHINRRLFGRKYVTLWPTRVKIQRYLNDEEEWCWK